jgi:hypothetical protein
MRQARSTTKGLGLAACFALILLATAASASAQETERPLPAPAPVADDALTDALETGELTEAEYALERARSLFQLGRVRREFGDVARPAARDATLILRDLVLRVRNLSGSDRAAARRLLARPPQGDEDDLPGNGWSSPEAVQSPRCGANVCVHWVDEAGDPDAPPPADVEPADTIPDWVQLTLDTWENVWLEEIDTLDYREPLPDLTSPDNGGDALLDVYLEDLGEDRVFGYCTSDDPANAFVVSAYCVVDDDFSPAQFPGKTPKAFLEVTSAHEFHHASQFAYDVGEDSWFMEGTAANVEETVYPKINDNVNFLRLWSPLTRPASPLDRGGFFDSEYGAWIFWRFLQERIGDDILEEIWRRADVDHSPDDYSLLAVRHAFAARSLAFRDVFARFGIANRLRAYADAQKAKYPRPPLTKAYTVSRARPLIRWAPWRINHLATRYFAFRRGRTVKAGASIVVRVRLPAHGARASVIVVKTNGSRFTRRLEQNADGNARARANFGRGVKQVELVLSNGSTRISCWTDTKIPPFFSCYGRPRDDRRVFELRARLGR